MGNLLQDLRFAFRQFRRSPGFVATAILSLMLGIGATTAIFSVVYGVLLDPYPYKDANRMVHVELRDKNGRGPLLQVNGTEYPQLRAVSSIDDVFLQQDKQQNLTGEQFPISVNVGVYSPNLFQYMGVPPLIGRGFSQADITGSGTAPVAVLSYQFWKRQYGGSRDVLGKTIELDHTPYSIIGVATQRFTWGDSDVYLTANPTADPHDYWLSFVKLRPGTKHATAAEELQVLVDRISKVDPKDFRKDRKVAIVTLNEEVLGKFAGTLVLLFGAVLALLIIGCANVSILLLARGTARQHELAVRVSVGAGRSRLIRQLLTESVVLSVTGAALGVLAAYKGVDAISAMLPYYSFPHEASIRVNAIVLLFSAGVAVLTGTLSGISPAWQISRPHLSGLIQASSSKHSGSARSRLMHRILIAGQVALTILLMAGAGAAIRSFVALIHTPLGFDPENVVSMDIASPRGANPTWEKRIQANETVRHAIEQTPGVTSAAVSTSWFPGLGAFNGKIELQSKPTLTEAQSVLSLASSNIFSTMRIPLLEGRVFDDAEVMRGAHVALVNEAFAKQYLADTDPIGQRVRSPALKIEQPNLVVAQAPDDWLEIIGVVGDARNDGLERPIKPAVFIPYSFILPPDEAVLVRVTGNPEAAVQNIQRRLRTVNGELVVSGQSHTISWWLSTQGWGREQFIATLFAIFAALALALAAAGVYSVVSYAVTQRTQELGIRMALGAQRSSVVRLVLTSTAITLGTGLAVGLALSLGLSRVMASWAGGSSRDPMILASATLLLAIVATFACLVPAWRAASIDPMRALRIE
jgi:predicted permease